MNGLSFKLYYLLYVGSYVHQMFTEHIPSTCHRSVSYSSVTAMNKADKPLSQWSSIKVLKVEVKVIMT